MKAISIAIGALFSILIMGACSNGGSSDHKIPDQGVVLVPSEMKRVPEFSELSRIGEIAPNTANLVWLKKDFWLGRKIWISLGVERSSITGLSNSVIGYIPAEIERVGSELVLRRQNRGLYGGSTLAPDFLINTYPIVSENTDAILVDLADPKTSYGLSTVGLYAGIDSSTELAPRVDYLKSAIVRDNGVAFTNVIVAKSPERIFGDDDDTAEAMVGLDPYLLSATIRTDWITEIESPSFLPFAVSDEVFGFFTDLMLVSKNGVTTEQFVNKIDTSKPMTWTMSSNTPKEYQESVEQGILAWNSALGSEILRVELGKDTQSFTDPKTSNLSWDDNEAIGMAFANWRSNPYTGEIVQAQVYMSGSMWATNGRLIHRMRQIEKSMRDEANKPNPQSGESNTGPEGALPAGSISRVALNNIKRELNVLTQKSKQKKNPKRYFLAWNASLARQKAAEGGYCFKETETLRSLGTKLKALEQLASAPASAHRGTAILSEPPAGVGPALARTTHNPYPAPGLSADQFAKNLVRGVVMHEVGHTMGLRHNFLGSTESSDNHRVQSASIMDYNDLVIDASFSKPGASDLALMKSVYGNEKERKQALNIKFCTDGEASAGMPGCVRGDFAANPLDGLRVQQETNLMLGLRLLSVGQTEAGLGMINNAVSVNAPIMNYFLFSSELGALISQDPDFTKHQEQAFALFQDSKNMLGTQYPAELKTVYAQILIQMLAANINPDVPQSEIAPQILGELGTALVDPDGSMDISTRKAALSGLQRFQDFEARAVVVQAQEAIAIRTETETDFLRRMEDEEVLTAIAKMLRAGFIVDPKN